MVFTQSAMSLPCNRPVNGGDKVDHVGGSTA